MDKESMSPKSTHKPASILPLSKALLDFVQFPPEWRVGSTEQIIARLEVWESIRKTKAHSQCLGNPRSGGQPSSHGLNMCDISHPSLDMREQRGFSQNMVERHHIGPQDDHPHSGPGSSGGGRWSSQLPFGKSPIACHIPESQPCTLPPHHTFLTTSPSPTPCLPTPQVTFPPDCLSSGLVAAH
ncbi:uncharacterized protein EI90DRAFT_3115912 [Cantharellus anzutake]|uniref:uncharacterized protein n=1 Tax=Cantharellus anzutake TaxID=1750568 RepID=UPI00190536DC|nr:uncharacterized protein EI90DRAFT_3115912 [Cantharellus anzutake]KAF8342073.1 hypothetical protein EI90DRAFT_3115912 [Cantharellus anzutake]